jgi:flagellar operon protein
MIVNRVSTEQIAKNVANNKKCINADFKQIFDDEQLRFSKHANERLKDRKIELSGKDINNLESAVKKAGEKGIHTSLVLMNNRVFIVNVKSGMVITATDKSNLKENIFTNIDGAVIV